jgi:hypothetical protein
MRSQFEEVHVGGTRNGRAREITMRHTPLSVVQGNSALSYAPEFGPLETGGRHRFRLWPLQVPPAGV